MKPWLAALTAVGLLAVTGAAGLWLRHAGVAAPASAAVAMTLPAQVGRWTGEGVYYCQNERCLRSFRAGELAARTLCPACGGTLDTISLGERTLLPADTLLVRNVYQQPGSEPIYATIVLTGSEQRSIHRPEQCLPAQGFAIESSRITDVPRDAAAPLRVLLLRARQGGPGALAPGTRRLLFAYWFAGGRHETPRHGERLFWMAWDTLAHGARPRWSYISVQTAEAPDARQAEARLKDFLRDLYPLLRQAPAPRQ